MKRILPFFFGLACVYNTSAQTQQYLDANRIYAGMDTSGHLFRTDNYTRFEVPAGSNRIIGFNTFPVITGMKSGNAYVAYEGNLVPGPLTDGSALPSTDGPRWSNVWKVTIDDVNDHLTNYTNPGYVPSAAIANWPAMGNSSMGDPTYIAPFIDVDADGMYDPMAGDYPDIRGAQTLFVVDNDQEYSMPGLGLEVQTMAYVFDCPYDSALQNTIFVHYKIINKSASTYTSSFAGLFADIDLGNHFDDYMASDVKRGMFYVYNGDNFDEPDSLTANSGLDSLLPVIGVVMLGGPWQDADEIDNGYYPNDYYDAAADNGICYKGLGLNYGDGIADNERMGASHLISFTDNSTFASIPDPMFGATLFYKYMSGNWLDGTPVDYGGNGHAGDSGVSDTSSKSTYFNDTDPAFFATNGIAMPSTWNEISAGNAPGNKAAFASAGSFTIAPGEINEMDFAFIAAYDYTAYHNPLAGLPILQQRADTIRHYFTARAFPCGALSYAGIAQTKTTESALSLYPNPVRNVLSVTVNTTTGNQTYLIRDISGKMVQTGMLSGNKTSIDVSTFENGIYLITLNHTGTQKFVVQH